MTFGPGGDVDFVAQGEDAVTIVGTEGQYQLEVPFQQAHCALTCSPPWPRPRPSE